MASEVDFMQVLQAKNSDDSTQKHEAEAYRYSQL